MGDAREIARIIKVLQFCKTQNILSSLYIFKCIVFLLYTIDFTIENIGTHFTRKLLISPILQSTHFLFERGPSCSYITLLNSLTNHIQGVQLFRRSLLGYLTFHYFYRVRGIGAGHVVEPEGPL